MSEKELQDKIIYLLKEGEFYSSIEKIEGINSILSSDNDENSTPYFYVDYLLRYQYAKGGNRILKKIKNGNFEIITGSPNPKNISLRKDSSERRERLYPDILLFDKNLNQIIIFELKKDKQTEREAITELTAYALEIKNHLPFISDSDISFVLIASDYSSLLEHSLSSIVLSSNHDILALKTFIPQSHYENRISLNIHLAENAWSSLNAEFNQSVFSSLNVRLYPKEKIKQDVDKIINEVKRNILYKAQKLNSHGFFIFWDNITYKPNEPFLGFNIFTIDPTFFLNNRRNQNLNIKEPFSNFLIKNLGDISFKSTPLAIGKEIKRTLSNHFEVIIDEKLSSFKELMIPNSTFRSYAYPMGFDSWGMVGDYLKYYYSHPGTKNRPWYKSIENLNLVLTSPFLGLNILYEGLNYRLFKFGLFNASSIHKFGRQLKRYTINCEEFLFSDTPDNYKAKVYYDSVEIGASIEEINIRFYQQPIEKTKVHPPIIKLIVNSPSIDNTNNLHQFKVWFEKIFLGNGNFYFQNIFNLSYQYQMYFFNENLFSREKILEVEKILSDFIKSFLIEIIREIKEDKSVSNRILKLVEENFLGCTFVNSSKEDLIRKILSKSEKELAITYEEKFLPLLDLYLGEVFHTIDAAIPDTSKFDWDWEMGKILEQVKSGHKYLGLFVSTNGEYGIWNYENSEDTKNGMSLYGTINYDNEIPVFVNNAGVVIMSILTWKEIKNGGISRILPKT